MQWTFDYAPTPWWKWRATKPLAYVIAPLLKRHYPLDVDRNPPETAEEMNAWLHRWGLTSVPSTNHVERLQHLMTLPVRVCNPGERTPPVAIEPLRLCAEWELVDEVLMVWPIWYPGVWPYAIDLLRAIAQSANVGVLVPTVAMAAAVRLVTDVVERVSPIIVSSDDVWIRDFGPITGMLDDGSIAALDCIYDPPPTMPYANDDSFAAQWAALTDTPFAKLPLHLEGGNVWTDGNGLVVTSATTAKRNGGHRRIEGELAKRIQLDRLIVLPPLPGEQTGHVDLMVKPLAPNLWSYSDVCAYSKQYRSKHHDALWLLQRALGHEVDWLQLPAPNPRRNALVVPVVPSYCNSLSVNGSLIVPTFRCAEDDEAMRLLNHAGIGNILPVDASVMASGGGTVHCTTMQIHSAAVHNNCGVSLGQG